MRMVAFIPEARVIRFILDHLGVAARRGAKDRAVVAGTRRRLHTKEPSRGGEISEWRYSQASSFTRRDYSGSGWKQAQR